MIRRIVSVAVVLGTLAASRASAQKFMALGLTNAEVMTYMQKLQRAVRAGDRPAVASLVNYPLRVNSGPKSHVMIASSADLIRRYDFAFPQPIRDAIINQPLSELAASTKGLPIKGGAVWVMSVCDPKHQPVRCSAGIGAINLPAK